MRTTSRRSPHRLWLRPGLRALLAAAILPAAASAQRPAAAAPAHARQATRAPAVSAAGGGLTTKTLDALKLRFIGPAVMSGRITALAVPAAAAGRVIYAGSASGGVWKTDNAGTTWTPAFQDGGFSSIGDVAVAPSDPDVVWVGTGERNSLRSNGWGDGVYRSTDGGRTWKHMGLDETREIGRIVIDPRNPDVVYVAALGHLWGPNPERGIYRTNDAGRTWKRLLFVDDTTGFVNLKIDPHDPDVLYAASWHRLRWGGPRMEGAGAGSGIWKTTDGGATWTRLTESRLDDGLPSSDLGRIGLALSPKDPRILYAVVQVAKASTNARLSAFGGVFRTDDAGAHWSRVNDLSAVPDYYYNDVWLNPSDPDNVWFTATTLDHSTDGGRSIARFDTGRRMHGDFHAMWIDPADARHMMVGNDGGLYISWDGGKSWAHQMIPVAQFYEADLDSTRTPYHVCGGLQDNGVWCGPSRTPEKIGITNADWYMVYGGDGFRAAVPADSPTLRFAESQYGDITRLDVVNWRYTPVQPQAEDAGVESGYPFRWDWDTPFILSPHDPSVLYVGGNRLFRMPHHGRSWTILGPDMTRAAREHPEPDVGHTAYHALHSIAESPLDARILWTGSDDGLLWTSADAGATWTDVTGHIPNVAARHCVVSEIAASHFSRTRAYVSYDCHDRDDYRPRVYRTDDAGRSFTAIARDLPADAGSHVVLEDAKNAGLLFVGTERGLWMSINAGRRWVRLHSNLPTVAIRDLDESPGARELVVPTFGRGVWILDLAPLQQLSDSVLASRAFLFDPPPARQYEPRDTYGDVGDRFFAAPNPRVGATLTYWLGSDLGKDATLTIRKATPGPAAAPAAAAAAADTAGVLRTLTGPGRPGLHSVVWDLTSKEPRPRELGGPLSPEELERVAPGTYTVTLDAGDQTLVRTLDVRRGWFTRSAGLIR